MYELKLIKGKSYTGIGGATAGLHATAARPVIAVEDEATANAAVASGFFSIVSSPAPAKDEAPDSPKDYSRLTLTELKAIASARGISTADLRTKADYAAALASADLFEEMEG